MKNLFYTLFFNLIVACSPILAQPKFGQVAYTFSDSIDPRYEMEQRKRILMTHGIKTDEESNDTIVAFDTNGSMMIHVVSSTNPQPYLQDFHLYEFTYSPKTIFVKDDFAGDSTYYLRDLRRNVSQRPQLKDGRFVPGERIFSSKKDTLHYQNIKIRKDSTKTFAGLPGYWVSYEYPFFDARFMVNMYLSDEIGLPFYEVTHQYPPIPKSGLIYYEKYREDRPNSKEKYIIKKSKPLKKSEVKRFIKQFEGFFEKK